MKSIQCTHTDIPTKMFTIGKEYMITNQKNNLIEIKDNLGHWRYGKLRSRGTSLEVLTDNIRFIIGYEGNPHTETPKYAYFKIIEN